MKTEEVLAIIDAVIGSLSKDQSQFPYVVHTQTTGLKVQQSGPGVGYISNVTGQGIET